MPLSLAAVTIVVPDYDEAIAWFTDALGFAIVEDTPMGAGKRWVLVEAPGSGSRILIARASGEPQAAAVGRQAGGRVAFFLHTDDFARDHARMVAAGTHFREEARHEDYGTVAVFEDPWGNPWDLIEPAASR
jgi:catechol 2,3-dioxygenase-like lactoylglutathione lyase family enzyme